MNVANVTIEPIHRLMMDYEPRDFEPPKKNSFVYVFLMENGTIKIGKSRRVKHRKSTIEHSSGMSIVRYWKSHGHTSFGANNLERIAHEHFSDSRLIGEFFNAPYKKAIAFIKMQEDYIDSLDENYVKECHEKWMKYEAEKKADRDMQSEKCFKDIFDLLEGQVKSVQEIPYLLVEIGETKKVIEKEIGHESGVALKWAIDAVGRHHKIDMSKLEMLGKTEADIRKEIESGKKIQLWSLLETAEGTKKDIVRKKCIHEALMIISSDKDYVFFNEHAYETDDIFEFAEKIASDIEKEYSVEHEEAMSCACEIASDFYCIDMRIEE